MKKYIIMALLILTAGSGCQKKSVEGPVEPPALDTVEKKVSYVIGYNSARQLKSEGYTLDAKITSIAVEHLNSGTEPLMTDEEMRAAMSAFQAQLQENHQQSFNQQAQENLQHGQAFLAENAQREGITTTESGLQYEILTAGTGESPKTTDSVSVNYKGSLITGEIFDSGESVSFTVNQLIPGWVEALPLMKVGAKWKLFIPADLAYGSGGTGAIGPNSTLIFEMQLLSIDTEND